MNVEFSEIKQKYLEWDAILHKMNLLDRDKSLQAHLPAIPRILVIGSHLAGRSSFGNFVQSKEFVERADQIIHFSTTDHGKMKIDDCPEDYPEFSPTEIPAVEAPSASSSSTFDLYWMSNEATAKAVASGTILSLLSRFDVVISISDCGNLALSHVTFKNSAMDAPILWLSLARTSDWEKRTSSFAKIQYLPLSGADQIEKFMNNITKYWPCLAAQRLEKYVRAVLDHDVPRLQRWRWAWMTSVIFLDLAIAGLVGWGLFHADWLSHIFTINLIAFPVLLAGAYVAILALLIAATFFLIRQVHRLDCRLCSLATSLLGCKLGRPEDIRLTSALRENTRRFPKGLRCDTLCGWTEREKTNATSFCSHCQTLRDELVRDFTLAQ